MSLLKNGRKVKMCNLRKTLEEVPDSYNDFIEGCLYLAKKHNVEEGLLNYIRTNPDANTGEIILAIDDLAGVEPTPLEIVD
jgi:hypothetical protein